MSSTPSRSSSKKRSHAKRNEGAAAASSSSVVDASHVASRSSKKKQKTRPSSSKIQKAGRSNNNENYSNNNDEDETEGKVKNENKSPRYRAKREVHEVSNDDNGNEDNGNEDNKSQSVVLSRKRGTYHIPTSIQPLLEDVYNTLARNVPERYNLVSFADFLRLLTETQMNIELLLSPYHARNSHNRHEIIPRGHASSDAAASSSVLHVAAAAELDSMSTPAGEKWAETRLFAACQLINDAVFSEIQAVHDFLCDVAKNLQTYRQGSTLMNPSDVSGLLQVAGVAYVLKSERHIQNIDFFVLEELLNEEQSAFDQVMNVKLRFAKEIQVDSNHPFYSPIIKPGVWSKRWSVNAKEPFKLSDIIIDHRNVDGQDCVILYHGTASGSLKSFKSGGIQFIGSGMLGRGFYLTASPNEAKSYACLRTEYRNQPGLVLEIAISNAAEFIGNMYQPPSASASSASGVAVHFHRDAKRPNQFVFLETESFRKHVQVLSCYIIQPGFSCAPKTYEQEDQYEVCGADKL